MSEKIASDDTINEMRELVKTGDISLPERRNAFKRVSGRDTVLDDEQLLEAIAATDDDDDELFASNVTKVEERLTKPAA